MDMQDRTLHFVITGTPRSGTSYIARLFQAIGFDCGHEERFNPWHKNHDQDFKPLGDSSWMAAPFLTELPPSTKVFHLVRDPVKAINSIIGTGQLHWPSDYRTFLARHFWGDSNYWPTDITVEAQHFWIRWNRIIEQSGRVTRRLQVERVREAIVEVAKEIKPEWDMSSKGLDVAVKSVPRDFNTRPHIGGQGPVGVSDLTAECMFMARRYGYSY
jgi:hypothetical protein